MVDTLRLEILPIAVEARFQPFDLAAEIWNCTVKRNLGLEDGDILVVSSKYAAVSEGRMIELSKISVGEKAKSISEKYDLDPALAQLILDESEFVFGGIPGFVLSLTRGTLAPNAGYDKSNVPKGWVIQYPKDPFATAHALREHLLERANSDGKGRINRLGVILSDSRVTPTRLGTVGVAVSYSGIKPTLDMRGTTDLLGNTLVVTLRGVADQLATTAQLVMGESNEGRPIVIIRGFNDAFGEARNDFEKKSTITPEQCLILRSLKNPCDSEQRS